VLYGVDCVCVDEMFELVGFVDKVIMCEDKFLGG